MPATTVHNRSIRALAVAATSALLLSGCGFNAQTLQPYTPAEGVNLDVADIKVRNVVVVSDADGNGILSGSIVSRGDDSLTAVEVVPLLEGNVPGAPLPVTPLRPVTLPAGDLVVLTDPTPAFAVSGDTLVPGQTVALSLTFASGGVGEVITPVMSSGDIAFETLAPAIPTPTP
ncbi:MAG: hypothetical protein ACK5LS_04870 [Propioniciclava sp.]